MNHKRIKDKNLENKKLIYTNNKEASCINIIPPKLPTLFEHNYSLESNNINSINYNKVYG